MADAPWWEPWRVALANHIDTHHCDTPDEFARLFFDVYGDALADAAIRARVAAVLAEPIPTNPRTESTIDGVIIPASPRPFSPEATRQVFWDGILRALGVKAGADTTNEVTP